MTSRRPLSCDEKAEALVAAAAVSLPDAERTALIAETADLLRNLEELAGRDLGSDGMAVAFEAGP